MRIIVALLLFYSAPSSAAQPETPTTPPACVQFSRPFQLAAQVREGRSEEETLALFQSIRSDNPSDDELLAEKAMISAIRLVYQHPNLSADEIQKRVQLACTVSPEGKVQFNGL